MEFKIEMANDVVVLVPSGNLVASETESFKSQVEKLLEKKFRYILLEMSRIDFMDSSGLGSVMAVNKLVTGIGGVFACFALQEGVQKVFRVTRADQKIAVAATLSDGLLLIQERRLLGKGR
ncbi:MAG: STAS domain-containing protein [Desulfuromonadales bacterium]